MEDSNTAYSKRNIILLVIGGFIILAIILVVYYFLSDGPHAAEKVQIKEKVSQKIDRKDFDVDKIIVDSNGWQLASLVSNGDDKGNPALVIIHVENGTTVIKFGPGTYFVKAALDAAGVPLAIENALFASQPQITDPLFDHLPYQTNFYSVSYSGAYISEESHSGPKTLLTVTVYELPRFGIVDSPKLEAQYKKEIIQWIGSLGIDASKYVIVFTTK